LAYNAKGGCYDDENNIEENYQAFCSVWFFGFKKIYLQKKRLITDRKKEPD
jgi:hypothetical protein